MQGKNLVKSAVRGVAPLGFAAPAVAVGAAVALVVSQYVPLTFDGSDTQAAAQTAAPELSTVDTSNAEKQSGEPTTGANLSASDYGIDANNLKDGTYEGSGTGFSSTITVRVTISGGKIVAIDIVSSGDDAAYFSRATGVISSVIAQQSTNVDTVSGATYSSKGILMAIRNALVKASGGLAEALTPAEATNASSAKAHVQVKPVVAQNGYADGSFEGECEGYRGTVRVRVTVADGKIANVEMLSNVDDAAYFGRAWAVLPGQVVAKQTTDVDTVSGATYSSEGILGAVADALEKSAAAAGAAKADDKSDSSADNGKTDDGSTDGGTTPVPTPNPDDDSAVKYEDGTYTAYALCQNAEEEDAYDPYYAAVTVTIKDGKVAGVSDVHGTNEAPTLGEALDPFNEENQLYLDRAINGRTYKKVFYEGVVSQILSGKGTIDVVTGATYSSQAIAKAYERALAMAAEAYQKAHPAADGSTTTGGTDTSQGTADVADATVDGGTDTGSAGSGTGSTDSTPKPATDTLTDALQSDSPAADSAASANDTAASENAATQAAPADTTAPAESEVQHG